MQELLLLMQTFYLKSHSRRAAAMQKIALRNFPSFSCTSTFPLNNQQSPKSLQEGEEILIFHYYISASSSSSCALPFIQHAPHSLSALQKRGEFLCSLSRMTQCLKIPKIVPICLYRVENRIRLLKSRETPSNHFCQLRQFGWNFQTLWMMALET